MRLDIGLIGATGIAERAVLAPARRCDDVTVQAVAASDPLRARAFASRNDISRVYTYSDLITAPEINTVYVSVHNSAHAEWVVRAAEQGKHVIVEKPLCLTGDELEAITRAARVYGVHIIEAVPTIGHPWQAAVRQLVTLKPYGTLRSVHADIHFLTPAASSYRTRPELGGGIFLDAAPYWLQAVQATTGLTGGLAGKSTFDGPNQTDTGFDATLGVATLHCQVGEKHLAEIEFRFEQATVKVRNLLRPTVAALPLNLAIRAVDGSREIRSFPAVNYYDTQLDRIRRLPDELAEASARIQVMADIYANAREAG